MEWVLEAGERARQLFRRGASAHEALRNLRASRPARHLHVVELQLDGALNFERGIGAWTICVTERPAEGQAPIAAAVYSPETGELFTARAGQGAWRNGAPISPSSSTGFHRSIVALDPGDAHGAEDAFMRTVYRLLAEPPGYRTSGVTSWDLCHVAAGVLDGAYVARSGSSEEEASLAAPWLILKEAGARALTGPEGEVVAANPFLLPLLARAAGLEPGEDLP